ncbi:hypothetical protein MNV49_003289 [Pseudohyphozyma bogoriensis]|nr:hypothetical protein MNV49_003289 [Pseudohyphozyma bogoriensis]
MNEATATRPRPLLVVASLVFLVATLSLFLFPASSSPQSSHFTSLSASAAPLCRWTFSHYEQSSYEASWLQHQDWLDTPCASLNLPEHVDKSQRILSRTIELFEKSPRGRTIAVEEDESDELFSRMVYQRECWDRVEPLASTTTTTTKGKAEEAHYAWVKRGGRAEELIEPLWGFLRDPYDKWCGRQRLVMDSWTGDGQGQSKLHIIPAGYAPWRVFGEDGDSQGWKIGESPWMRGTNVRREVVDGLERDEVRRGELKYFDLGSAYFSNWHGDKSAASGKWIFDTYATRLGLKFRKFVCVELDRLDPDEAYRQLPGELFGAYTLMNTGLDMTAGSKKNAMTIMKQIAEPGDFLAFKLDIDHAPIEMPIAHALRDDKQLASLVSELFFMHQSVLYFTFCRLSPYGGLQLMTMNSVDIAPMRYPWGSNLPETLRDSYELFIALRENGIRAHSWP